MDFITLKATKIVVDGEFYCCCIRFIQRIKSRGSGTMSTRIMPLHIQLEGVVNVTFKENKHLSKPANKKDAERNKQQRKNSS